MRLLVLGAGYVGRALLKSKAHFFLPSTTSKEKLSTLENSLLIKSPQDESLKKAIDAVDGAIILIAPKENTLEAYKNTYLEMAKAISSQLKNRKRPFYLLQIGSTSAYQKSPKGKVLLETETLYQECKNEHTSVCTLRLGGIFGPGRELIKRAKIIAGKTLPGTGKEPTNHIHLDDIVLAILFCLDKRLEGDFNLVNEEHRSREKFYSALCSLANLQPPSFDPSKEADHGSFQIITNEKIKKTGFTFTHPLCDVPN